MATRSSYSRSAIAKLLTDSKLYTQSKAYKELLDFVVKLRNYAPFNAMLLQIQKPGLSYAASARHWQKIFKRKPKEGARPLLILQPFGPVSLVYDVMDTEGDILPEDVQCFPATGVIRHNHLEAFMGILANNHIEWAHLDAGDKRAGYIRPIERVSNDDEYTIYGMYINRNHPPPTQFATLVHELAHLFLGHLGEDKNFRVPNRTGLSYSEVELEAESVSYLVCARNGVESKSESYLSNFVDQNTTIDDIDIYIVLRAAQDIEKLLELSPSS